ncbi:MAG: 5'-nucleotidase, lipoprotein e(P4) family [Rhodospirillaceae bacterium]
MSPCRRFASVALLVPILALSGAAACAHRATPPATAPAAATAAPAAAKVALPDSVAWFRTSVEYRAITTQSYRLAALMLERALADRTWTAALEQTGDFGAKPPAVILDVDETVLDNSESEERSIREGAAYSEARWAEWCNERKATPIPGALEFTRAAAAKGVTVFYVTNRDHALEPATRDNLAKYRFPLDPARDTVLTRAERPEWASSEKSARRSLVAQDFRILLLVGDDFGDFVAGARGTLAARKALSEANAAMWGVKWIVLPNPMYGSWKTAAGQ